MLECHRTRCLRKTAAGKQPKQHRYNHHALHEPTGCHRSRIQSYLRAPVPEEALRKFSFFILSFDHFPNHKWNVEYLWCLVTGVTKHHKLLGHASAPQSTARGNSTLFPSTSQHHWLNFSQLSTQKTPSFWFCIPFLALLL